MPEHRKTVFISCGQYSDEEKELGRRVSDLVVTKSTPFEWYFAQDQTTLETLSENVLRRLYESVGGIPWIRESPTPSKHARYLPFPCILL